jgi:hypothetical protein
MITKENIKQKYLDINQISHLFKMERQKVYQLYYTGKIDGYKKKIDGVQRIVISRDSVEDYKQQICDNNIDTSLKYEPSSLKRTENDNSCYTAREASEILGISINQLLGFVNTGGIKVKNPEESNATMYIICKESVKRYKDFVNNKGSACSSNAQQATSKIKDVLDVKTLLLLLPNFKHVIEEYQDKSLEIFFIDTLKKEMALTQ